jgi:hypothetical protein
MILPDKWYNTLKWIAMFFLPALATLVRVIFAIWNIPYGEQISATIVAINTFLGAILGISNMQYHANKELGEE